MIRGAVKLEGSQVTARARMASALARLTIDSDQGSIPVREALRTTALGRVPAGERAWAARIEARRRTTLGDQAHTGPPFDPDAPGPPARAPADPQATVGVASAMMSLAPHWCLLLMRLVREHQPRRCLELGTGFGISAAYQAAALELNGDGELTTIEGSADWARIARANLEALGLDRVEVRIGPIEAQLAATVTEQGPFDFLFVDAEHQAKATLAHFELLLPGLADGAVVVLDDADWTEMRRALDRIAADRRVRSSLVIGRLGILTIGRGSAR